MIRLLYLALFATAVIAVSAICVSVKPKLFLPSSHSPSIAVSVAMEGDRVPVGQKPRAILTVRNIGSNNWVEVGNPENYRVHVDDKSGELPRRALEVTGPAFDDDLPPGMSRTMKWELSSFYNLSAPGDYSVYFEVQEEPGVWLRTDIVQFEMLAGAQ